MSHRALVLAVAALLVIGACSSRSRTVVVAPPPPPDPRRMAPPQPPPLPPPPQRPAPQPPPPPPVAPPVSRDSVQHRPGGRPSTAATLGVPPGHLPEIGECRVWIPGTPSGRQPRPKSRPCAGITAVAPTGSWIIYRPTRDKKLVHVRVVDARRPGTLTIVRIFELDSGRLLRETRPEDEPQDVARNNEKPNNQRPQDLPAPPPAPPAPPPTLLRPDARPPVDSLPADRPPPPPPPAPAGGLLTPDVRPPVHQPDRPADRPADKPADRPAEPAVKLDIPRGHLPDDGECRVWVPGTPPGQQAKPKSRSCDGIAAAAPAGSWILYRPAGEPRLLHVRIVDAGRAGHVTRTLVYDVETNQLVREENP